MARRVEVEIVGDSSKLERAFKRSERSAGQFKQKITGTFQGGLTGRGFAALSAGLLGGAGVVAGMKGVIDAASDMNEQMSKTDVVFGDSAKALEDWSQTSARAMGLSRREALATASSFGALFRPLGVVGDEAAKQSEQLTQLGADLASFYNTDVQDALDAVRSGLVGESEPLRRYGILLSETRVQQEAMRQTGKKHAQQLTDQEKVLARISLIFKDAAVAQGDFSRTSGGLANQQRILRANLDNLRTTLGQALLPTIVRIVTGLNNWLSNTQNTKRVTQIFTSVVEGLGTTAQTAADWITKLVGAVGGWKNALAGLVGAWAGFKAAGVGAALTIQFAQIAAAETTAAAWRAALISTGWGVFAVAAGIAASYVVTHWEKVKIWFSDFFLWLAEAADRTFAKVVEIPSHFPGALGQWARDAKKFVKDDLDEVYRLALENQKKLDALNQRKPKAPQLPATPPAAKIPKIPGLGGGTGAGAKAGTVAGFVLPFRFQLAQARADLTKSIADDVRVARQVVAFIQSKRFPAHSKKLLDAYQLMATAMGTIRNAADQAAQASTAAAEKAKANAKAAAEKAKAAAKAAAEAAKQFGVPLVLQAAEARAQALGKGLRPVLLAIKRSAEQAIKSGRLGLQGLIDAYNTITSVNEQLAGMGKKAKRAAPRILDPGFGLGFGRTAGGTLTAGAGGGGVTIHNLNVHGVQNVRQLENELVKRSKSRPHPRRGS